MNEHLLNIKEVAGKLNMTPRYFSKLIKQKTSTFPKPAFQQGNKKWWTQEQFDKWQADPHQKKNKK
jgi:predicted DNA-binding transcriptional regulator AlpA